MFVNNSLVKRAFKYPKYLLYNIQRRAVGLNFIPVTNFSGYKAACANRCIFTLHNESVTLLPLRYYSKKNAEDVTLLPIWYYLKENADDVTERDLIRIKELFPLPRSTLNELNTKTPDPVFDIQYKQNVIAPKGTRKKIIQNDWTCIYTFTWPEKRKFESTAISKRQAAEKAATHAVHWLYTVRRIDSKGSPIYDAKKLDELKDSLYQPININVTEHSVERINRIWEYYENNIKSIYEETISKYNREIIRTPHVLKKDSTIDEDDEFQDNEITTNIDPDLSEVKQHIHPVYGRNINPPSQNTLQRRDRDLTRMFLKYDEELTPLPIDEFNEQITSTIAKSPVTIIVGAAGCGKSTRAPPAVLRHCGAGTAAIVSEPRRVAAIGLAERVASELGEMTGESVGYQVRLDSRLPRPPAGSILYCTSGVLLRRLQLNPGLEGCSHVFIDEAHERDVNTDITLLLLKKALQINHSLKIVVMSATLDVGVFTKYFDQCPVIEVPGRTYPVEVYHLEDVMKRFNIHMRYTLENCRKNDSRPQINCNELVQVIKAIDKQEDEGAILVFLPGWGEIKCTKQLLDECFSNSSMHMILPVHSRLSTTDQTKMFSQPTRGVRKIVLATNIAETSITIPDVVYVVDSGAHKENTVREGTGTASLETVWVSQAGAKQRTGRAGRVQPGKCFRLYTLEKEADFPQHTTPEILRIPLEQTVLDCKTYAPENRVEDFLSQLPEPPTKKAIQLAVNDLVDLGALTPMEQLTRLGSVLSTFTLHPRLACALLHAGVSYCVVGVANVVAHCSANVELFVNPADRRDEIRAIKSKYHNTSDHAALHFMQQDFEQTLEADRGAVDNWCEKRGMRRDRMFLLRSLSNLHLEQLLKCPITDTELDAEHLNKFSDIDELISAILLSGVNSLIITKKKVTVKGKLKTAVGLFTSKGDRAHIGTESVNYAINKRTDKQSIISYFGGYHSTERRALVVHKTSLISPHMAVMFCKGDVKLEELDKDNEGTAVLSIPKHRLKFHTSVSNAQVLIKAKEMLWKTFDYYVHRNVKELDFEEYADLSRFRIRLIKAIAKILVEADREYVQGKSASIHDDDIP